MILAIGHTAESFVVIAIANQFRPLIVDGGEPPKYVVVPKGFFVTYRYESK